MSRTELNWDEHFVTHIIYSMCTATRRIHLQQLINSSLIQDSFSLIDVTLKFFKIKMAKYVKTKTDKNMTHENYGKEKRNHKMNGHIKKG